MYLSKRRIVKKRCLYEFTLRAVHQFYKEKYNQVLKLMRYEERTMPGLVDIEENLDHLVRDYTAKNRC